MKDLREFVGRYRSLWGLLGVLFVLGNVHPALGIVALTAFVLQRMRRGDHQLLIFTLVVIFILGDSRVGSLQFVKPLRTVILLLLFFQTVADLVQRRYPFRRLTLLLVPFFILSALVSVRNPSPILSFSKALSYVLIIFVAMHYFNHHIRQKRQRFLRDLVMLATLACLIGLGLRFVAPDIAMFDGGIRYRGIFGNPNGMGVYGSLMFPVLLLYLRFTPHGHDRRTVWLIFGALLISVFLSFSRNALTCIMLFLLLSFIHKGSPIKPLLFYGLGIPSIVFLLSGRNLVTLLELIGLAEELRAETLLTGSGRVFAWQWAIENFLENPILGRGFAFEEILFHKHMPEWLYATGHQGGVHNSYLSFLLNTGIVGLTLILIFWILLARWIRPAYYRPAIMLSAGFSAFFEPWLNSSLNAFTVHLLLLILLYSNFYLLTGQRDPQAGPAPTSDKPASGGTTDPPETSAPLR